MKQSHHGIIPPASRVCARTSGSLGNVAGLLEFCIKNNYLSGGAASSVQSALMGKLSGGASSTDSGYSSGLRGVLSGSNGSQLDLGGGGLKQELTKQVCDKVLDQGKSMIGGGVTGGLPGGLPGGLLGK